MREVKAGIDEPFENGLIRIISFCLPVSLTRLPQLDQKRQCFCGFWGKSFHYNFFWIIFEGSLRRSFSRIIPWWSDGLETQRVRISRPLRVGSTTSIERISDISARIRRGSLPRPALSQKQVHGTCRRKIHPGLDLRRKFASGSLTVAARFHSKFAGPQRGISAAGSTESASIFLDCQMRIGEDLRGVSCEEVRNPLVFGKWVWGRQSCPRRIGDWLRAPCLLSASSQS